jgi:hypothetical protein
MGWNHRVLAHEHKGEIYFQIHEVYYDDSGTPNGYTENSVSVGGESLKDIGWTLNRMKECLKKPILWAGDKFPSEYIE